MVSLLNKLEALTVALQVVVDLRSILLTVDSNLVDQAFFGGQ